VSTYQTVDLNAAQLAGNTILYRIKQVDFNGEVSYSAVRRLGKEQVNSVLVYPNPAKDFVTIELDNELLQQDGASINVFTLDGKKVIEKTLDVTASNSLNISELNAGNYIITIQSEKRLHTFRLVIE
jgi:hypothetical protein